jgi:3-oxoacyl-[acyl-carrier protein] reductase
MPEFLVQKSGNMINISSCVTSKPVNGLLYYCASKGAVDVLTRGLAAEFTPMGIRVNGVSPSQGDTKLAADFVGQDFTSAVKEQKALEAPMNRLCTASDIARACLYFAAPYFNAFHT